MADLEAPDSPTDPVVETPPPAAPETPPDPVEAEPDGTIEAAGQKHVPLGTLIAERREKQALKAKADQFDQLAGYVNQVRPYIDFLAANPTLMTRTQQDTQPTPTTTTQPVDQKAETLARTLDLYTADGQPDVKRAQAIRGIIDEAADEKAEARVRPLQQSSLQRLASDNLQRAIVTKAPDGRAVPEAVLREIWTRTDPAITADETKAAGIVAMALGLSIMQGTSQTPPAAIVPPLNPPLHTEPPGGRNTTRPTLSRLDESIAKLRGIAPKDYAERTKSFTAGRPNVLEDN